MTTTAVNTMLGAANVANVLAAVAAENPVMEFIGQNMSVAALMAVFWWRECKARERCEKELAVERDRRIQAENKCGQCKFVKLANEEFLQNRKGEE